MPVRDIMDVIAEELGISVLEVRERATKEDIVHQYYQYKFNWDPKDDSTIPF